MGSMIGKIFKISVFGESHGRGIGVTIENIPAGFKIDFSKINLALEKRRGIKELSTYRREKDHYEIISGYFNDKTTGTPLTIIIYNQDVDDRVYDENKNKLRPGHADYTAYLKYQGYQDYRGGGHFSGRITSAIVIAGEISNQLLAKKGIKIASRIKQIYDVYDEEFCQSENLFDYLNNQDFPTFSPDKKNQMFERILNVRNELDSLGGIVETYIEVNKHILGDPIFESVESKLSNYLFAIGGLKGISFGKGFEFASLKGSQANDNYRIKDNHIYETSNNNGGINGGITNGQVIAFNCVIKPTPSIGKSQKTVDIIDKKEIDISIRGRHDPCIVPRALYVINALSSLAIIDLVMEEYGKRYFLEEK